MAAAAAPGSEVTANEAAAALRAGVVQPAPGPAIAGGTIGASCPTPSATQRRPTPQTTRTNGTPSTGSSRRAKGGSRRPWSHVATAAAGSTRRKPGDGGGKKAAQA